MSTLTWITEKELEQEIKTKETNFVVRITWKFYNGGKKTRNVSGPQGENEWQQERMRSFSLGGSEQTSEQEHIQHFLLKTCN